MDMDITMSCWRYFPTISVRKVAPCIPISPSRFNSLVKHGFSKYTIGLFLFCTCTSFIQHRYALITYKHFKIILMNILTTIINIFIVSKGTYSIVEPFGTILQAYQFTLFDKYLIYLHQYFFF